MSVVSYQVRRAMGPEEMRAALALRHEVFCREQGVPEYEELDGRDDEGIHLVAIAPHGADGGERGWRPNATAGDVVGTCRLLPVGTTVQFSRLAVRSDARRQGVATKLLELADAESRGLGARRLVLHAQTYARSLYDGLGYRARGRTFVEAGIEHIAMEKVL